MVTKILIIIPKKREKEMISRMKFWCVRLRERGEMFTKMMENVVVNDQLQVEKVLYSRAFFYVSSGAENDLKTYFVFGALTKSFHKGPKSYFSVKKQVKFEVNLLSCPTFSVHFNCSWLIFNN